MTEISNSNLSQQVYNAHGGDSLINQVRRVLCVLMPRALTIAGFSEHGDLLMIRYSDYKKNLPAWILDFFEHQFINEPLFADPNKVTAAFIAGEKSMVVPEVLFNETASEEWMKKIYFVEGNEIISKHHLREDKANYMYAWPGTIKSLMTRYFGNARILPFAAYQFYKPYKSECSLQCCITSEHVYATLYNNRTLHWHQVFPYDTAEDIAYQVKLLCKQNDIEPLRMGMQCTMANKGLATIVNELAQFFPDLKDGTGNVGTNDRNWTGTIYLLQQLYACAL
ncbi:MAG: DUF3822 family protein [Bacteroidetes bacterium]|nr:DUF3822 family protein [Bacteroidota bacterium]